MNCFRINRGSWLDNLKSAWGKWAAVTNIQETAGDQYFDMLCIISICQVSVPFIALLIDDRIPNYMIIWQTWTDAFYDIKITRKSRSINLQRAVNLKCSISPLSVSDSDNEKYILGMIVITIDVCSNRLSV